MCIRDSFVTKVRYAPEVGWNAYGTAWVDYYGTGDGLKDPGPELTQAVAAIGHRWETGNELEFAYNRSLFPQFDREEFLVPDDAEIANGHHDRLSIDGSRFISRDYRLHSCAGAWKDEADSGGDLELGLDKQNFLFDSSHTDFTLFG